MVLHLFDLDGAERPRPDVQDHKGPLDAPGGQGFEEGGGEVEAGGGSGHAARLARVDRLVAFAIRGLVRAADVGREGDVAPSEERRLGVGIPGQEADPSERAPRLSTLDAHHQVVGHLDCRARPQPPSRPDQRVPGPVRLPPHQEDFGLPAARAPAEQPRREHPATVQDQEIAGIQNGRELAEPTVGDRARPAVEDEQA